MIKTPLRYFAYKPTFPIVFENGKYNILKNTPYKLQVTFAHYANMGILAYFFKRLALNYTTFSWMTISFDSIMVVSSFAGY